MKRTTNVLLLLCAGVIGLIAREVLADALSDACPGSITFDVHDISQLSCPANCRHNGTPGNCLQVTAVGNVDVWYYDMAAGSWKKSPIGNPPQPETYHGTVEWCMCRINAGTEQQSDHFNPCCIIARIPAFDTNPTHRVGIAGTCPSPPCPNGQCKASGNNNVVTAVCD